jgi:signal peptidase I
MRTGLRARWVLVVPVVVIACLLLGGLVVEPLKVRSDSMAPTFEPGDQVLVLKVGDRSHSPHRGDVVVLSSPGSGERLIKRVAGVAGDRVGIEDGVLVVNGATVRERYVDYALTDSTYFGPVTVPAGEVFVLGDDRANSVDSRSFGPVPTRRITGRVWTRLWPPP